MHHRVLARSVSIQQEAPEHSTVDYQGRVSQYDPATSCFTLTLADGSTCAIRLAANVAFDNGSAADLVDGASVEVEGIRTVDGLTVYGVEFQTLSAAGSGDSLETQGLIYDDDPVAASFRINGLTIHLGAAGRYRACRACRWPQRPCAGIHRVGAFGCGRGTPVRGMSGRAFPAVGSRAVRRSSVLTRQQTCIPACWPSPELRRSGRKLRIAAWTCIWSD